MKLFVLTEDYGHYPDKSYAVVNVFSSEELANKEKCLIEQKYEKILYTPSLYEEMSSGSPEEWEEVIKWQKDYDEACDFSGCYITECELNKPSI